MRQEVTVAMMKHCDGLIWPVVRLGCRGIVGRMVQVSLRPMTSVEYDDWLPRVKSGYVRDKARWGGWPEGLAREIADKQFASLLPDGLATVSQHVLIAEARGVRVGHLWLHLPDGAGQIAFVCEIEVDDAMRGRGYGRAIMLAGEEFAREHGASSLRLNVFAENVVARRLYESMNFAVTDMVMMKSL